MKTQYIDRPFEVKAVKSDGTFEGVASPFGELDFGNDIVMPGAFTKTLAEYQERGRKVKMLWQHQIKQPIGIYPILKETDSALVVTGQCNMQVQQGRECHALMEQGAMDALSIGYIAMREEYVKDSGVRILHEVKLMEISPVTFPMADNARITLVKSLEGVTSLSECEAILRDADFSRKEATAFIARVKALVMQSDSAGNDDAARLKRAIDILRS